MLHEKSAGIIVYRQHHQEGLQFLVMYHNGSYWNFPKGHVEEGESELEAAVRELKEEAGLAGVKVIDGWRQQTGYLFKETHGNKSGQWIKKEVALYLARAPEKAEPRISFEHNGYAWLTAVMAAKYLKFKNSREILAEAESFIESQKH